MDPGDEAERRRRQRELERSLSRRARDYFPDPPSGGMPRLGDGVVRQLDMVERYAQLTAVAFDRAAWYGELLDAQVGMSREQAQDVVDRAADASLDPAEQARALLRLGLHGPPGSEGLIGFTYTAAVVGEGPAAELERIETGEGIRALVVLEGQERDRAAKLLHQGIKIGVQVKQVEAMRAYGDTVALSLIHFARQLGLDPADVVVGRAAARAVLAARIELGANEGDPDRDAGPPLDRSERARVLTAALAAVHGDRTVEGGPG